MNNHDLLDHYRYHDIFIDLANLNAIRLHGPDAESFLHNQVTTDVRSLEVFHFHTSARLNRGGQVKAWFFILKEAQDSFLILLEKGLRAELVKDLQSFIIMEEVEIEQSEDRYYWFAPLILDEEQLASKRGFSGRWPDHHSIITTERPEARELAQDQLEELMNFYAWPSFDFQGPITNTVLSDHALNLKKGCFLGQETVSKIINNRGAAYYPIFFKLADCEISADLKGKKIDYLGKKAGEVIGCVSWGGENFLCASVLREMRVEQREFEFQVEQQTLKGKVIYPPFFKGSSAADKAQELYALGVELFQKDQEEQAISYLEKVIELDPTFGEAYESLGVLLGRHEKFQEAIDLMDRLLEIDPDSVMGHTNKSLYYMKIGEIEKAEDEKAKATVASFKSFGKEAKSKRELEERKKQEAQELAQREDMFRQVLEIDQDDVIANYGLADIYYLKKEYQQAQQHLERVLSADPKYSVAYLLYGKVLEALKDKKMASEVYERGIVVASKKGDMMPANEMQSRLNELE